jgi:hypothetical protein
MLLGWTYRVLKISYYYAANPALPRGETPEGIVEKLVQAYLDGTRKINPEVPLELQLRNAVRSRLSALHRCKEAKTTSAAFQEMAANVELEAPSPSQLAEVNDSRDMIFNLLRTHPKVLKSLHLRRVVDAFARGIEDEDELAKATKLPISRIYELRKQLREIYPVIRLKLQREGVLNP